MTVLVLLWCLHFLVILVNSYSSYNYNFQIHLNKRTSVMTSRALRSARDSPIKVGLTGSIGMGKSTITNQLKKLGFPVFDADATVHKLYSNGGGAIGPLSNICPSAIVDNAVDRKKLMEAIMKDSSNTLISRIESIVHPLVEEEKVSFYKECKNRYPIVFYDIPLLFETMLKRKKNAETENIESNKYLAFDYIVTVTASAETQRNRVLSRPGMTEDKLNTILAKQVADEYKRSHSDFLIVTDFAGYSEGKSQLAKVIDDLFCSNQELVIRSLNLQTVNDNSRSAIILTDEYLFDMERLQNYRDKLFWDFVESKMPSTYQLRGGFPDILERLKTENTLLVHDNAALEKMALNHLCSSHAESVFVDEAIQIKENAVTHYDQYITKDGQAAIELACGINSKVGLITSFNIKNAQEMLKIDTVLSHSDVGTTELSVVPYLVFSQLWNISPKYFQLYSTNRDALKTANALSINCMK